MLVWLADLSRLGALGRDRDKPTDGLDYLEMLMVGVVDAALAAQNATVALESLGLGSVYIGALRNDPEAVAELLGLPRTWWRCSDCASAGPIRSGRPP